MRKDNPLLDFYIKNSVSPVRQNIEDFKAHSLRREKLYLSLGMPLITFDSKMVCEVGPGGGYNSLVFLDWGSNLTLIEPNPTGVEDIEKNFEMFKIDSNKYVVQNCVIEKFIGKSQFDIVIAEGFLPGICKVNRKSIIKRIDEILNKNGIVTVTCIDSVSMFFELLRRLIGKRLLFSSEKSGLTESIELLTHSFSSHFSELKYASRPCEDWVTDNLINPALVNDLFGIDNCFEEFPSNYELLGSSPNMFTDYSWYKDYSTSFKEQAMEQFMMKRHLLIDMSLSENVRDKDKNDELVLLTDEFKKELFEKEEHMTFDNVKEFVKILNRIKVNISEYTQTVMSIQEAIDLLMDEDLSPRQVSQAKYFRKAFGRGMQYISLVKR